jgi:hypothetical protein
MKRGLLYGGIGLIVILLLVGGGLYYELTMKTVPITDKKVAKIVDTGYKVKLPNIRNSLAAKSSSSNDSSSNNSSLKGSNVTDSKSASGKATSGTGSANGSSKSRSNSNSSGTKSSSNTSSRNSSSESTPTKPTSQQILAVYKPSFTDLKSQADSRLNSLMVTAYDEYKIQKASGEKVSYLSLYQKYKSSSDIMQTKVDASFNTIYSSLQSSLKEYGYSPDLAKTYQNQYNQEKQQLRNKIVSKAMSMIKG